MHFHVNSCNDIWRKKNDGSMLIVRITFIAVSLPSGVRYSQMSLIWPQVCARCGTTEDLKGETVSISRQKTEKVGSKQYRSYDVEFNAHIYLCSNCESIAKVEFEELIPVREKMSRNLLILALITSLLSIPLFMLYNLLIPDFWTVIILTFILPGLFWTLVFSNSGAAKNFELAGYRRFFVDWTLNGPIRFTNQKLLEAFKQENQHERYLPVMLVDSISRSSIETPDTGDCCGGICLGLIIVLLIFFVWSVISGAYNPLA